MELRIFSQCALSIFEFYGHFGSKLSSILVASVLCGCGREKGKEGENREFPLMPVDSGILRSVAF